MSNESLNQFVFTTDVQGVIVRFLHRSTRAVNAILRTVHHEPFLLKIRQLGGVVNGGRVGEDRGDVVGGVRALGALVFLRLLICLILLDNDSWLVVY